MRTQKAATCSQRMLAKDLGLSTATVSRALHNDTAVNEKTRQRVQEAARRLGWRPNFIVNTVMREIRTKPGGPAKAVIGVIGKSSMELFLETCTYRALAVSAERAGFTLDYFDLGDYRNDFARLEKVLLARGIGALILISDALESLAPVFDWENFCAIVLSSQDQPKAFNQIAVHRQHDVTLAYRHLTGLGYRNIGLVATANQWDETLLAGYLLGQYEAPPMRPLVPLIHDPGKPAHLRSWLRTFRPDAVISTGSGSNLFASLRELSVRVPQDLAVAVLHLPPRTKGSPLAGIRQPWELIADTMIEQLGFLIASFQRGPMNFPVVHAVEGEWVDGASAPARHPAPRPGQQSARRGKRALQKVSRPSTKSRASTAG